MRSFQVFSEMTPEQAEAFFSRIKEKAPAYFTESLRAASAALKTRPTFLLKQPFPKQVNSLRRALSRVASNPVADEALAMYFLEVRRELLTEWLDGAGIPHEDGALQEDSPAQPAEEQLRKSVAAFRSAADDDDRELLLRAFAAQGAIEWPVLDELLAERSGS